MTLSLTLAAVWALAANILAMIPSRDNHWTAGLCADCAGDSAAGLCHLGERPLVGAGGAAGRDVGAALAGDLPGPLYQALAAALTDGPLAVRLTKYFPVRQYHCPEKIRLPLEVFRFFLSAGMCLPAVEAVYGRCVYNLAGVRLPLG